MQSTFTAAPHDDVLRLLLQIALLLFAARALGEVVQRLGQPAVVGELLAGIVLGPSLLSGLVPAIGAWIVPQTAQQGYLLELVSLFGAMFMLLITGLEIDVPLIRRKARPAIGAAIGGLIVPFASGFLLAHYLPNDLLANPSRRLVFTLFVATAMSISAIPVIAKVLMDLNLMRRDVGQIIIAAGMIDDTVAWIMLSIVVGLASGVEISIGSVAFTIGKVLAFIVLSFTAGYWIVKHALNLVQEQMKSRDVILSLVIVLAFTWGAITHSLHLEAVLGSFAMGIIFSQMPTLPEDVIRKLQSLALGIFAPIFFAVAGLKVHIWHLLEPRLVGIALLVIAVACFGKIIGTYIGARLLGGRDHWTALTFGAALNARGAVEIIIATIGLSSGILSQNMFSIIVLMAMTTSLMAPSALRWVFQHVPIDEQEMERLRREELSKHNLVANVHRVLLPLRWRDNTSGISIQMIEAHLLEHIGKKEKDKLSVTLMTVANNGEKGASTKFLNTSSRRFTGHNLVKKVLSGNPSDAILNEARKGYDLLVLGAPERGGGSDILFTPMVDYVLRLSPCPTIVVHGTPIEDTWKPRRILVPTNGSIAARRAAEVGFSLASAPDQELVILKVVGRPADGLLLEGAGAFLERQFGIAYEIVDELRTIGESLGVRTLTDVRTGPDPETVILEVARSTKVDLIILGTNVRTDSERLYMGSRVERILKKSPCPVLVVNAT